MSSFQRDEIATLRSENTRLRALLVKACVEIANRNDVTPTRNIIAHIGWDYGIRLRWTGAGFEEDTTK